MKTAGIFVGEFGYELFCWSGYLRGMSSNNKIVVFSKSGHELLYRDFADCVSINFKTFNQNGPSCEKHSPFIIPSEYREIKNIPSSNLNNTKPNPQYIKFGKSSNNPFKHILLHIRKKCSDRDWDVNKWRVVLDALDYKNFSYKFVGSKEQSVILDGYPIEDMRGCSLDKLSNLMADSQTIVGPSSGIMHFATLCGLHQTVWSSSHNKTRYLKQWNPFNTEVTFLDKFSFNPPTEYIIKELQNVIK